MREEGDEIQSGSQPQRGSGSVTSEAFENLHRISARFLANGIDFELRNLQAIKIQFSGFLSEKTQVSCSEESEDQCRVL